MLIFFLNDDGLMEGGGRDWWGGVFLDSSFVELTAAAYLMFGSASFRYYLDDIFHDFLTLEFVHGLGKRQVPSLTLDHHLLISWCLGFYGFHFPAAPLAQHYLQPRSQIGIKSHSGHANYSCWWDHAEEGYFIEYVLEWGVFGGGSDDDVGPDGRHP